MDVIGHENVDMNRDAVATAIAFKATQTSEVIGGGVKDRGATVASDDHSEGRRTSLAKDAQKVALLIRQPRHVEIRLSQARPPPKHRPRKGEDYAPSKMTIPCRHVIFPAVRPFSHAHDQLR